ncbi:MAG TPA: ribulose-phosphate 3-epimerase [Thermoanaerobaculia bacterium]|nr:ribulose-phosphate 3-epimerase [Thermoanaerobaculia bacterium]
MSVKVAPSILAADFSRLGEEVRSVADAGADLIHIDVMDGHFVPNITLGSAIVRDLRKETDLPFDCHLMISEPQRYIQDFINAGANMISIHTEAEPHLHRALRLIRDGGALAGIALNPATACEAVADAIDFCDFLLVMSVNPGFGGQKFIPPMVAKIRRLSAMIAERGRPIPIEVDGGIGAATVRDVVLAGAGIVVAGTSVFGNSDRRSAIESIRTAADSHSA